MTFRLRARHRVTHRRPIWRGRCASNRASAHRSPVRISSPYDANVHHGVALPFSTSFSETPSLTFTLTAAVSRRTMDSSGPMDIDPIDDGPREVSTQGIVPLTGSTSGVVSTFTPAAGHEISKEEEARQAIDMLRGEDVSQRVAAASRLESVAAVLGEERTRNVSLRCTKGIQPSTLHLIERLFYYYRNCSRF